MISTSQDKFILTWEEWKEKYQLWKPFSRYRPLLFTLAGIQSISSSWLNRATGNAWNLTQRACKGFRCTPVKPHTPIILLSTPLSPSKAASAMMVTYSRYLCNNPSGLSVELSPHLKQGRKRSPASGPEYSTNINQAKLYYVVFFSNFLMQNH